MTLHILPAGLTGRACGQRGTAHVMTHATVSDHGVPLGGLVTHETLKLLAVVASIALAMAVAQGGRVPLAVFAVDAALLVMHCRRWRAAADLERARHRQARAGRRHMAAAAAHNALLCGEAGLRGGADPARRAGRRR